MTRKRFIKLLMAKGVPRNVAVRTASTVVKMRRSYESAWTVQLFADEVFQDLRMAFNQAVEALGVIRAFVALLNKRRVAKALECHRDKS